MSGYRGGSVPKAEYKKGLTPLENSVMQSLANGIPLKRKRSGKRALVRIRRRLFARTTYHALALWLRA